MNTPRKDWVLDADGYRLMRGKDSSHQGLIDLCDALPPSMTGLEIGSFAGESAEIFMASGKCVELYCVDIWTPAQAERHNAEARFDARHANDPRIRKCKGTLRDWFRAIPPVDFAYIDADHDYVPVMRDIGQALLMLKPGGIIAGHDHGPHCPGVERAVNEYFGKADRVFKDSSWMVRL